MRMKTPAPEGCLGMTWEGDSEIPAQSLSQPASMLYQEDRGKLTPRRPCAFVREGALTAAFMFIRLPH